MKRINAFGVIALLVAIAAAGSAQDTPAAGEPMWQKDRKVLELEVLPLTADEITGTDDKPGVLKPWMDAVKAKAKEHAALEIAGNDEDAKAKVGDEKSALIARAHIVLKALKAKGGDPAKHEAYLDSVSGSTVNPLSPASIWAATKTWFLSPEGGLLWLKNILAFLAVLVAFKFLSGIAGRIVSRALTTFNRNSSELLRSFVVNCTRKTIFLIGLVVALSMLGIEVGPFIAAIGAAGFIIGFALQGTLANFAAGLMILLYRPFDVGQVVSTAGVTGKVDAMTLVSTTVKTPDNQTIVIPNGKIWGDVITNVTGSDTRRVDLVFGVGYGDDLVKAGKVLEELVNEHSLILKEPAPVIKVHELADSSVNFIVRPWAKTGDYWNVYWDLTRSVKDRFDAEGISIPFPQRDVHMHQVSNA